MVVKVEETKKISSEKSTKKTGLSLPVYDLKGKEKSELEVPKEIFSQEAKPQLLAQAIRVYLFNQRQGTASTKTRAEVAGSTRKIYRQKGTGRARHGDIKAPIFVGGGVAGGPKPKEYSLKINKKQKRKALLAALSLKLKEKSIMAITDKILEIKPKTKELLEILKNLNLVDKKVLFVLPKLEKNNLVLAGKNLNNVFFVEAKLLNTYEVLKNQQLIFLESAIDNFVKHFLKKEN